jgi:hypothetical protein
MKFKRRKSSYHRRARSAQPEQGAWTEDMVARMLANPVYCGLKVDPIFTLPRPIEPGYVQTAMQIILDVGPEAFLRNFFARLRDPSRPLPPGTSVADDRILSSVMVHPALANEDFEAVITEDHFIEAGVKQIENEINDPTGGAEQYLTRLLDNLRGDWA